MSIPLFLTGYGNVGRNFVRLLAEKGEDCRSRYGLDFDLAAVFRRGGAWIAGKPGSFLQWAADPQIALESRPGWTPGLGPAEALDRFPEKGVLVDCTPSDWRTGEPQLPFFHAALDQGWHIAAASKGALVVDFKSLRDKARAKRLALKFSGATAAALPTLDVSLISLAGAKILGFDGILTGTTNYILGRLEAGLSFESALREAQAKGIAEPDPSMDIDGWDTACKLLLIANSAVETDFTIEDIKVEGIRNVTAEALRSARAEGTALKLLGRLTEAGGRFIAEVKPVAVLPSHPLSPVSGTSKGIAFFTDTMGTVCVTGGKSDPRGTAAALLKDIINIYRDRS